MEMDISERTGESDIPEIILHSFTKEQFLSKFKLILSDDLSSQDIQTAWIGYLESVMEPRDWLAIWIPSQKTAEHYECKEGEEGSCVVEVLNVDPRTFVADVEILRSVNHHNIEEKQISVDVAELYPLSNQANNDYLLIQETAEALTLYRCFYKHIWRPWDEEEDTPGWVDKYLEARIDLMMDHTSKSGNYSMAKRLQYLASEAQRTKDEISELEDTAVDVDDDEMDGVHAQLQQLALRAHEITHEAKLLDDPVYGKLNFSALKAEKVRRRKENRTDFNPTLILVWRSGPVQEMADIMDKLKDEHRHTNMNIVPNLEHALDIVESGDTVIIAQEGPHEVGNLNSLSGGGRLFGLQAEAKPVIVPSETSTCFLCVQGQVDIRNVEINLSHLSQTGIMVKKQASLNMKNCVIKNCEVAVRQDKWSGVNFEASEVISCKVAFFRDRPCSTSRTVFDTRTCEVDMKSVGCEESGDDTADEDEVFTIKSVDMGPVRVKDKKSMREDFEKLSRLHRVSSSTPKSEICPLDTAKVDLTMESMTDRESMSTAANCLTSCDSSRTTRNSQTSCDSSRTAIGSQDSCDSTAKESGIDF